MSSSSETLSVAGTPWCDVEPRSLSWSEGGQDLVLSLRLPASLSDKDRDLVLRACWARDLRVSLAFAENANGYPVTWDVVFEHVTRTEWFVRFEFGSLGDLSFRCTSLELKRGS
jgi:hypothetical protein